MKLSEIKKGAQIVGNTSGDTYTVLEVGQKSLYARRDHDGTETVIHSPFNFSPFQPERWWNIYTASVSGQSLVLHESEQSARLGVGSPQHRKSAGYLGTIVERSDGTKRLEVFE